MSVFKWIVCTAVAAIAAVAILAMLQWREVSAESAVYRPVTLKGNEFVYSRDGTVSTHRAFTRAFRADGSSAESSIFNDPNGKPVERRKIYDLEKGVSAVLDGLTDSITTYSIDKIGARRQSMEATTQCAAAPQDENIEFLGFKVFHGIEDLSKFGGIAANSKKERWISPEWNCLEMKTLWSVRKPSGDFFLTTSTEVTAIIPGEPDPILFALPASGYIERSPSEVMAEFARRFPNAAPHEKHLPTQDQIYNLDRP